MNRDEAIAIIEGLYPADSDYKATAAIGQGLLARAEREVNGWRDKPDTVLIRYAELCEQEEDKTTRDLLRKPKS